MARAVWPYAVMRRLHPEDSPERPVSVHRSAEAAQAAADRESAVEERHHGTPGAYIAVHWGASRRARECWPCCGEA